MKTSIQLPVILGMILSFPISGYAQNNVPPTCEATFVGFNASSERFAQFTVNDDNNDLRDITITKMINSTTTLDVRNINDGSSTFKATKIDQSQKAIIEGKVSDSAGNVTQCASAINVKVGDSGESVQKTYPSILKKAGDTVILYIQNTNSGIDSLEMIINGGTPETINLPNAALTTRNISSDLQAGSNNTIAIRGFGDPNATAYVIIYGN